LPIIYMLMNKKLTSGFLSNECDGWFRKSSSELPKPMKPFIAKPLQRSLSPETPLEGNVSKQRYTPVFGDRQSFKNLSIYISQLPVTPWRVREEYLRSELRSTHFRPHVISCHLRFGRTVSRRQGLICTGSG
jgi:hypothetical protein